MERGHVGAFGRPPQVGFRPFITLHQDGGLRLSRGIHAGLVTALVDDAEKTW